MVLCMVRASKAPTLFVWDTHGIDVVCVLRLAGSMSFLILRVEHASLNRAYRREGLDELRAMHCVSHPRMQPSTRSARDPAAPVHERIASETVHRAVYARAGLRVCCSLWTLRLCMCSDDAYSVIGCA